MGGAECSTAGNPLSQFSKIGQDDKSLQRDRLVGRGPGSAQGMRSTGMNGNQDNVPPLQHSLLRLHLGALLTYTDDERVSTTGRPTTASTRRPFYDGGNAPCRPRNPTRHIPTRPRLGARVPTRPSPRSTHAVKLPDTPGCRLQSRRVFPLSADEPARSRANSESGGPDAHVWI